MAEASIIYCTSNMEHPLFEQRVRDNILAVCGGIPIVSVSQKSIDFGQNICVGDVGVSGFNFFRQTLIACEAATTPFVICCEADCFYPPDYFQFVPERDDRCYRNTNLYVMPQERPFFWRKQEGATHAQVIGREFYLERLRQLFEGQPRWSAEQRNFPKEVWRKEDVFEPEDIEYYESPNPVVQVKTHRSMRHYTHSERVDTHELPYWKSGRAFREKFYDVGERH